MPSRFFLRSALLLGLAASPTFAQRPVHRVATAADIAAGGWHRLTDAVGALMPGRLASVDGFNVALTSERLPFAGLSATGSPQWVVRLDGQRMPIAVDGMWILDELPVAMAQVDSVTVEEGPAIVDGQPSLLGRIDIFTRRLKRGVSGIADYQHGDESGDPGPYRYTPKATPNVEKLGPFTSGTMGYAQNSWSIEGAARYSSLNITDTSISRRFPGAFGALQSDVNASGGSGLLRTSLLDGDQNTLAGRGRFTGLLWGPSRRREESVRAIVTQGGSAGTMDAYGLPVRYGVSVPSVEIRDLTSPLALSVDGGLTTNDGFVEALMPDSSTAVGVGYNWAGASGQHSAPPINSQSAGRLWVDLFRSSPTRHVAAALMFGSRVAASMEARDAWRLASRYTLHGAVAFVQRLPGVDGAGYSRPWTPVDPLAPKDSSDVTLGRTTATQLRVDVVDNGFSHIEPTVGAEVYEIQGWRLDPRLEASNIPRLFGDERAIMTTFRAGLQSKASASLSGSLFGEVTLNPTPSHDAMAAAMRSTPTASLRADVSKVVMSDWRLSASARLATSTTWPTQGIFGEVVDLPGLRRIRSEEHTSELQSRFGISYAVFCL